MLSTNNASASGRGIALASSTNDSEYRTILPRLPSGSLVLNSIFLHGDLAGRSYRANDFRDALREVIHLKDIRSLEQFQTSHVWMADCASTSAKTRLVSLGELRVKGRKCLIFNPDSREIHFKLLWLPLCLEDKHVVEALPAFGVLRTITREKWRVPGMEHMETLNREVYLALHESVSVGKVPHLLDIFWCQSLLLVTGRPPLCLRCDRVGHVRHLCRTPRCSTCRRCGHSADECVTTYAAKLPLAVPADDPRTELLMDASDVLDVSGDFTKPEPEPDPPPPTDDALAVAAHITSDLSDTLPVSPPDASPTDALATFPEAVSDAGAVGGPVTAPEVSEVSCPTEDGVGHASTSWTDATVEDMNALITPDVESSSSAQGGSAFPHGRSSVKRSAPCDSDLPLASAGMSSRHSRGVDGKLQRPLLPAGVPAPVCGKMPRDVVLSSVIPQHRHISSASLWSHLL